jgi:hypothetical protein
MTPVRARGGGRQFKKVRGGLNWDIGGEGGVQEVAKRRGDYGAERYEDEVFQEKVRRRRRRRRRLLPHASTAPFPTTMCMACRRAGTSFVCEHVEARRGSRLPPRPGRAGRLCRPSGLTASGAAGAEAAGHDAGRGAGGVGGGGRGQDGGRGARGAPRARWPRTAAMRAAVRQGRWRPGAAKGPGRVAARSAWRPPPRRGPVRPRFPRCRPWQRARCSRLARGGRQDVSQGGACWIWGWAVPAGYGAGRKRAMQAGVSARPSCCCRLCRTCPLRFLVAGRGRVGAGGVSGRAR